MSSTRIGPYRLEDKLGAGGMGVVYRAYDERLDRWVAVKVLHPGGGEDEKERLRREARASARVSHPAIVRIFDLVEQEGSQAIVMELVEGESVAERIRQGTLAPEEALMISREVSEALAEAHTRGIVHRDLKAENVLVTPDGHARILDFGLAKRLDGGELSLTAHGLIVGTARAMSPEQARGEEVDSRSDLFSLGVLFYEMFTEVSPFLAPTAVATLGRVCSHLPPPARSLRPELPQELSEIIDRLLEKQASRRPRDAREVARLLAEITPVFSLPVSERTPILSPGTGSGVRNRIEAAGALTPLVGCDQELGLLQERWELACEGRGQVVLLSGEAGLGKSRLVWELRQRLGSTAVWLEGQASPFHCDSAFHPILQWLDQWIGADREDAPEVRLARLEKALARHELPLAEACPLIAALLGLPAGDRWPLPALPPEIQRRRAVETLLSVLVASAERHPLLLVVEDLHWIDPSSSELLGLLAGQAAALPLMLLATFRPEGSPAWESRARPTRLNLAPLGRRQVAQMIERLCSGHELASSVREMIAERADGVPLFVEELLKMLHDLEGEPDGGSPREIPGSLEEWLGARLDRLETGRQVAQLAAVLGREFSQELLSAVAPWDDETLQREVDRLVAAEILHRQGLPPRCRYRFKHALLQDAAYASLLQAERQRFHRRVAEVLAERFPSTVESQPELAAHHFTAGGLAEKAVPLWQKAGESAIRMSAYPEALSHLSRALTLLAEIPESIERDRREVALQTALGVAIAKKGHEGQDEARQAYSRAWELCSRVGRPSDALPVLRGLYTNAFVRGKVERALKPAEELVRLARQENDPFFLLTAYQGTGMCHLLAGKLGLAREHLETSLGHLDARLPSRSAMLPGPGDPAVESFASLSWALWFLGHPDSALEQVRAGLALAGDDVHPQARGFLAFYASRLHLFRGEVEAAQARAQDFMALSTDHPSLHGWAALARLTLGGALVAAGRIEDGFKLVQAATTDPIAATVGIWKPMYGATIAEAWLACGNIRRGLAVLDDALSFSAASGQAFFDAELWRLRAGALLQQGGDVEAEVEPALSRALGIARSQAARSLELRAATDLARLWAGRGRREEARDLLAGIYGWFTEGFDTADLSAARTLLAEL